MNFNHNKEIEQDILGAIFIENDLLLSAKSKGITSDMFYLSIHQELYKAMIELSNQNISIDKDLIVQKNLDKIEKLGGLTYIADLSSSVPSTVLFDDWLIELKNLYDKRELIKIANYILTNQNLEKQDLKDYIENSLSALDNDCDYMTLEEQISDMIDASEGEEGTADIETGFFKLDEKIGGFNKKELITLFARSGVGKSTFSIQMALNMLMKNFDVIYLSNEMGYSEVINKMASSYCNIEFKKIRRRALTDDEKVEYYKFLTMLASKNNLMVMEEFNINTFISKVKLHKIKKNVDIVFVDYVNLILNGTTGESMTYKLGNVMEKLKKLAMKENIVVVALAQANRIVDKENKHKEIYEKITNADIQDSARIEQFSNIALALYRNTLFDNETARRKLSENNLVDYNSKSADVNPGVINFTVTKSRYGGQTTSHLKWEGEYSRIKNFER